MITEPQTPSAPEPVIPSQESAFPAAEKRDRTMKVLNFAGNDNTVKQFVSRAKGFYDIFEAQATRAKMIETQKAADAMCRLTESQSKEAVDKTISDIDCRPEIFADLLNIVVTQMQRILFGRGQYTVKFTTYRYAEPAARRAGDDIADQRNWLFEASCQMDKRIAKFRDAIFRIAKNKMTIVGMDWDVRKTEYEEQEPIEFDDQKMPTRWRKRTVKADESHPTLRTYDLEDVWFDTEVPAFPDDHQCIVIQTRPDFLECWAEQQAGRYINVDKLRAKHTYKGESPASSKSDRADNADEGGEPQRATGQMSRMVIWQKAPINAKGKWDVEKTPTEWQLGIFGGKISEPQNMVCLRLVKCPFVYLLGERKPPLWAVYSHEDDKTGYRTGYVDLIKPAYENLRTSMNQYLQRKQEDANAPIVLPVGAFVKSDKTFGRRKIFEIQGAYFDQVMNGSRMFGGPAYEYQTLIEFIQMCMARCRSAMNVTRPMEAEPMGSRTSALEYSGASQQAMVPFLERCQMIADQMLVPAAEWDACMWRQFADPKQIVTMVGKGMVQQFAVGSVCGQFRCKVTAVADYEEDVLQRLERSKRLQWIIPVLATKMPTRQFLGLVRYFFEQDGTMEPDDADEHFPMVGHAEAYAQADRENAMFWSGEMTEPQLGEDHETHLPMHEQFKANVAALPTEERPLNALQVVDAHIRSTKALQREETSTSLSSLSALNQIPGQGQGQAPKEPTAMPAGETAPTDQGQLAQQFLGAEQGGEAFTG